MIILYHSGGATDLEILPGGMPREACRTLLTNAARVLEARGETRAVEALATLPFSVDDGTNRFNDDFSVLRAVLPLNHYEKLRLANDEVAVRGSFRKIAEVISEIGGPFIRFIVAELALEDSAAGSVDSEAALKQTEIDKLVYKYIGVKGGYLGDFSYQSHREFYIEMDLPINPYEYSGSTRLRFVTILGKSAPPVQATILEGVQRRYPVASAPLRTQERFDEISRWILRLRGAPAVETPNLRTSSEVVARALHDAQQLLRMSGAASGVDRVHTALHGYLRAVCDECGLSIADDAPLPALFKQLNETHPAFRDRGPRADDILRVLRALGVILDALNPLRNRASVAHPNASLLGEPEAMLVVNSVRTVLHYFDARLRHYADGDARAHGSATA
jgi:Abortive infection C-terminus